MKTRNESPEYAQQHNTRQGKTASLKTAGTTLGGVLPELLIVTTLVLVGVLLRFASQQVPNFAPVAAIGLFAGCILCRKTFALIVPLLILAISDFWMGSYEWGVMASVFGCYAAMPLVGVLLKPKFDREFSNSTAISFRSKLLSRLTLLGCAVAGSILFFVVTNFAVWATGGSQSLLQCYVSAIPFYQYTLAGDLFFSLFLIAAMDLSGVWTLCFAGKRDVTNTLEAVR